MRPRRVVNPPANLTRHTDFLDPSKLPGNEYTKEGRHGVVIMISIIVCTHNRAHLLPATLRALAALEPPSEAVELVVVDNTSTDETAEVVNTFAATAPFPTRYVSENRLGHSLTLNTGIAQSQGEVLAFTDDDAEPRPNWLREMVRAFSANQADIVFGKVVPKWETGQPAWYSDARFQGLFALLDYGEAPFLVTQRNQPFFGVNHAVRRAVFEKFGPYRADRGGVGTQGSQGNDIELFERCLAGGTRIVYDPALVVSHFVPALRATKREQRRMVQFKSETLYQWTREAFAADVWWFGLPRWQFADALHHAWGLARETVRRDEPEAFFHELRLRRFAGLWREALRQHLRRT